MAARKTAAQKAAEAAERDEYTGTSVNKIADEEAQQAGDDNLTDVKDDKGRRLTVQQLKNKLRNEAEREVLDTHKAEVITITAAKYKVHNLNYVRRLTEEEKAAKQIEELYEKFPQLRPQLEQQQAQQEQPHPGQVEYEDRVEAVPGGALEQFRDEEGEPPFEEYSYEHGQPDGNQ